MTHWISLAVLLAALWPTSAGAQVTIIPSRSTVPTLVVVDGVIECGAVGAGLDCVISSEKDIHLQLDTDADDSGTLEVLDGAGAAIVMFDELGTFTFTAQTEGDDADLILESDQSDDNADSWRISNVASDNDIHFNTFASGSYVSVFELSTAGDGRFNGDLYCGQDATDCQIIQDGAGLDMVFLADGSFIFHLDEDAATGETFNILSGSNATIWSADEGGNVTQSSDLQITNGTLRLGGSDGVGLTEDGDGLLSICGEGNGADECLTINLDDTANEITLGTTTGASVLNWTGTGSSDSRLRLTGGDATIIADAVSGSNLIIKSNSGIIMEVDDDSSEVGVFRVLASGQGNMFTILETGTVLLASVGNTNNENITFDFETTANAVELTSSTGLVIWDFNTIVPYVEGSAGVDCTSAAAVTTINGIVTACS